MPWSELRADRVLREMRALCAQQMTPLELLSGAAAVFDQAVPTDASCWSTFDPATTMVTSAVGRNLDEGGAAALRFFDLEYARATPFQYRDLSTGRDTALIIADGHAEEADVEIADLVGADGAIEDRESHAAMREHFGEMGVIVELRVLFQHQGAGWGGAGLMRGRGSAPFTADEVDFARRIAPVVTNAVRGALVRAAAPDVSMEVEHGPAVLIVDDHEITDATPAATRWIEELTRTDTGHGDIPAVVRAVAAHAMAGRTVAQRARSRGGTWVVLRGAPLHQGRCVVTIEVAGPPEVASIVTAGLGLTGREIDVVTAVLKGWPTKRIAAELHLSAYTVQDHLKSVFAKAGVNSRRELVADVFFGVYAPRLGSPVGVDGFFARSDEGFQRL